MAVTVESHLESYQLLCLISVLCTIEEFLAYFSLFTRIKDTAEDLNSFGRHMTKYFIADNQLTFC